MRDKTRSFIQRHLRAIERKMEEALRGGKIELDAKTKELYAINRRMIKQIDRISLNFSTPEDIELALRIREKAGRFGLNRLIKEILRTWLRETKEQKNG